MTTTLTTTRSAVKATGLRKAFGDKVVLDGIDLDVAEGTVFCAARPERRGQDDDRADPLDPAPADAGDLSVAGFDL